MANKEMASSTAASVRAESNQPEPASVPASTLTTCSMMTPSSTSTVSSSRTAGRRRRATHDALRSDGDARLPADDLLIGIGRSFKQPAALSPRPVPETNPTVTHDGTDELQDTLKRMHSDNMIARKRRRQSDQAQANSNAGANANANNSASTTTSKRSPDPKHDNTSLPHHSKPE